MFDKKLMSLATRHTHWHQQFVRERTRLLQALGKLTEGGVIENVEHIGSTSVPELPGRSCVDVAIAAWPVPFANDRLAALEFLGYSLTPEREAQTGQRFTHESGKFQLFVVEAGGDWWTDCLIIRDYLRNDPDARQAYASLQRGLSADTRAQDIDDESIKLQFIDRMLGEARKWWIGHHGFAPVLAVAGELEDFARPWYISSGWALDLFLGRVTRVHHDVDVVISRADQLELQRYLTTRDWSLITPFDGKLERWPANMRLELPRHQVHAHRQGAFIDFLLTDMTNGVWQYRRNPAVIRSAERIGLQSTHGIPFLAPELALMYKSKNTSAKERSQDQIDFENVCEHLEPERRAWLRWALTVTDAAHPWIGKLA